MYKKQNLITDQKKTTVKNMSYHLLVYKSSWQWSFVCSCVSFLCLKALRILWSSYPRGLTEGWQLETNTPEKSSNLPCVLSQSSNIRETEATKAHVKEHKAFEHPGSLIDGCREWERCERHHTMLTLSTSYVQMSIQTHIIYIFTNTCTQHKL